jgi:hypothetical protein
MTLFNGVIYGLFLEDMKMSQKTKKNYFKTFVEM